MAMTDSASVPPAGTAGSAVRLAADDVGHPPIDLMTLRRLSDRERGMPSGSERARVRAKIAMYLPALLDLLDGTTLVPAEPPAPRLADTAPAPRAAVTER